MFQIENDMKGVTDYVADVFLSSSLESYRDLMLYTFPVMLVLINLTHSPARHTVSKAFLKSTNPQYSFFLDSSVKSVRHFNQKLAQQLNNLL